jgi:nitroimidazol reductase NimA-like FMN-containing flavoprotein (pyridoxamine 5'-phosphate oxidase superfamily)
MAQKDTDLLEIAREDLQALGRAEIERVLTEQRTVYVGFAAGEERYLIPIGYVWLDGCLCGFTSRGRKTRLAQADPRVSFQVDTSATTGHFSWSSVTGAGTFEVIEERADIEKLFPLMASRVADAPDWLNDYVTKLFAAGQMVAWRIRPSSITGVKVVPPDR